MRTSTRPAVLPVALLATLLVAGCSSAGESTDDPSPAAETTEPGDVDAPTEAADEPAPEPGSDPTAEFVATPPDTEVAIAHVDECSRPSDELSLDFSAQRTDGIVLDIEASAGTGTATASTPGSAGSEIAEESGPAQVTQQADGSLLVVWGEFELVIHNC